MSKLFISITTFTLILFSCENVESLSEKDKFLKNIEQYQRVLDEKISNLEIEGKDANLKVKTEVELSIRKLNKQKRKISNEAQKIKKSQKKDLKKAIKEAEEILKSLSVDLE